MKANRYVPALCGGQSGDLAAGTVSHQSNFLAAPLNGTENPQNNRQSGECRLPTAVCLVEGVNSILRQGTERKFIDSV
jgi:hypothetical protein